MVNKEAPGGAVILEGDLQPVRMIDLLGLEHGVEGLNEDNSFRAFGLLGHKETQVRFRIHSTVLGGRRLGFLMSLKITDTHVQIHTAVILFILMHFFFF